MDQLSDWASNQVGFQRYVAEQPAMTCINKQGSCRYIRIEKDMRGTPLIADSWKARDVGNQTLKREMSGDEDEV